MSIRSSDRDAFHLLVLAPNPWRSQWVNRQQLFSRIGRDVTVLYSTGGWFSWDLRSDDWQKARWAGGLTREDNVWIDESPRYLMRIPRLPRLDGIVMRLQVGRWKRFLRRRGSGPRVAYVYHPMFLPYVERLGADRLVYHAYDRYDQAPDWSDELERSERALLQHADLVVASSDQIAEGLRAKWRREVRVLPNGADVAAFDRALGASEPEPGDLAAIARPRLGWVGSLHPEIDFALIAELARRRPQWHFVLVGQPVAARNPRSDAEQAACRALHNVHFLGGKPVDQVARYVAAMDVNLMLYRVSDGSWINAIYPLKLHEYLAAGHPVVSADVPSVRPFCDVVQIARGADEWEAAIEDALVRGGKGMPDQRRSIAAQNSWDSRVGLLKTWLTGLAGAPGSAA